MALVTCASADVQRGRVHMALRGAWWAELVLDTATMPSGSTKLEAAGGFSLGCTILSGGVFLDSAHVQVVAGAGGLSKVVPAASFKDAQLRDPLKSVMDASGEALDDTADTGALSTSLPFWTLISSPASQVLDALCGMASSASGSPVTWRVLASGKIWIGTDSFPAAELADGDDVLEAFPAEGRHVIGASTPSLLPGVALAGVGKVRGVDHWLEPSQVRSHAWT